MFESHINRRIKEQAERNGVNHSNLLNIQIDTSIVSDKKTTTLEVLPVQTPGQRNQPESFQRSKIKMAHLNIRSLKNRDHLIQLRMLTREKAFDILAISESWLNSTVTNAEIEIDGYKLFRQDRLRKKGGGVCVYTRASLKTKVLKELSAISNSGFQQLWLEIQHKKLKSILLCVVYRPPDCSVSCLVDDFMENYTHDLTFGKEIFVTGDLNCNMLNNCPEAHALGDLCDSLNLTQLIKIPTRVTPHSSSLIDVILASDAGLVADSGVVETHISDHYLVYSTLKLKRPKPAPTYVTARNYKHYDADEFVDDLLQVPWYENSSIDDVNEKVEHFDANFGSVLDRHAPIKNMKIRYRQCPFLNQEIKDQMKTRDELHKLARVTKLPTDWDNFYLARNKVKNMLRSAEKAHVRGEIRKNNNNKNSLWKVTRKCLPRTEVSQPVYSKDAKTLANEFNAFFTSVGPSVSEASKSLAAEHDLPTLSPPTALEGVVPVTRDEFHFHPVSYREVREVVQSFPSNKAPGHDKVSMAVIKDALPCILPTLTEIVNRSLMSSVFPSRWKESEVIPLLKEGDPEIANNNRPISLLPAASKVCERIALNQLSAYMGEEKRLTDHQSGNKKLHSTETINILISDTVLESMDRKEITALVLLDLSKAFDSIDHSLLLTKLRSLGVSSSAADWFNSYLTGRSQNVRIGSTLSESRHTTHGVPQGSILGPVLFNIYINDLPLVTNICSLESYVDDSKLYISFPVKDIDIVAEQLTEDLRRIAAWCCANSLLINPNKTKLLLLGTRQMLRRVPEDFHVTFLGKQLHPVFSAKDLGVTIDANLTYDEHVTNVVSSCTAILCQINRIKHILDRQTLIIIINALVFSKLFYCSSVWANTSKKNLEKLQRVQNFAARIITGTRKHEHISPVLRELNWLPVHLTVQYRDTVMAFKCIKGLAPPYLCNKFRKRSEVHSLATRNRNMLNTPFFKSASGQRTFYYRATTLWNAMSDDMKILNQIGPFKNRLKRLLREDF